MRVCAADVRARFGPGVYPVRDVGARAVWRIGVPARSSIHRPVARPPRLRPGWGSKTPRPARLADWPSPGRSNRGGHGAAGDFGASEGGSTTHPGLRPPPSGSSPRWNEVQTGTGLTELDPPSEQARTGRAAVVRAVLGSVALTRTSARALGHPARGADRHEWPTQHSNTVLEDGQAVQRAGPHHRSTDGSIGSSL